jgi:hypothetical protein
MGPLITMTMVIYNPFMTGTALPRGNYAEKRLA